MKLMIAGGTGFIGRDLTRRLLQQGHEIIVVGRSLEKIQAAFNSTVQGLTWEQLQQQGGAALESVSIVINLTGASIGERRWTTARQQEILQSRLKPTQLLATMCAELKQLSPALFNASAVGIYGLQQSSNTEFPPAFTEHSTIDYTQAPDFLSRVGRQWELATQPAQQAGVRVVLMRFGVVLGFDGGALKQLKWPFLLGLGGTIGSGHQPLSWITKPDLIRAIEFLIAHPAIHGAVNMVAPQTVSQKEFAATLAAVLHRPAIIPMPAWWVKLLFGQMGEELLLNGQHVKSLVLPEAGYHFQYPTLKAALAAAAQGFPEKAIHS